MFSEKQLDQLEQDENNLTEEEIALIILLLTSLYNSLETELRKFYSKYGADGVVTYSDARKHVNADDHRKRMSVLLTSVQNKFVNLLEDLKPHFNSFLTSVITKESEFFDVKLERDDIITTSWGFDDLTWKERLEDDVELWWYNVSKDIKQSIMKRENIEVVLNDLNKRFVTMEHVIKRLALTESTAMGSIARRQIFKELGVKRYRFYAREDERTCDECGALHGLTFPVSAYEIGVNASPIHSRCRCWEVPIFD